MGNPVNTPPSIYMNMKTHEDLDEILYDQEGPPYIQHSEYQSSSDDHDRFINSVSGWWIITFTKYAIGASLALSAMYGLSKLILWAHRQ